jgi:hypothetical protein
MKQALLVFLSIFTIHMVQAQSPWVREKGKAYLQLGFTGLYYNQVKLDGVTTALPEDIKDITVQAYTEYGLSNNLEAQLIIPYKQVKLGSTSDGISGVGNITVGLKYKLYDKKVKISSGLIYSINSITKNTTINLSTGFNAHTFVPYVTVGSSWGKLYYFGKLGYGYMTNNYSDYLSGTFEMGYEVIKKGHIIFLFDTRNVISKESAFFNDVNQWTSYLDRQTFNAIGIKGNYEFLKDNIGANFAYISAKGINNAPLAPTLNLGIYKKL